MKVFGIEAAACRREDTLQDDGHPATGETSPINGAARRSRSRTLLRRKSNPEAGLRRGVAAKPDHSWLTHMLMAEAEAADGVELAFHR